MSGGVDSSVAAVLLQRQGVAVVGATLRLWYCDDPAGLGSCCDERALRAARRVCEQLGVPHHVVDAQVPFEREILEPAWATYRDGRTPSPCLSCNPRIKLGELLILADSLGASHVATGHYARLTRDDDDDDGTGAATGSIPALRRGTDPARDQSYFLARLRPAQLRRLLLPLGALSKDEVRDVARETGLVNAERGDSQDACLVGDEGHFAAALAARFGDPPPPGDIVDLHGGHVLGRHRGLHAYTVGQRKGLGIALGVPAYVARLDVTRNRVVVTTDPADLDSTTVTATGARWLVDPGDLPGKVQLQHRYRSTPADATVTTADEDGFTVEIATPQRAVTPGQAAVLYQNDRVLGSGWITRGLP